MPSQADEESHQLSYLQKHMANILTLLADSVDGEGDDCMVSFGLCVFLYNQRANRNLCNLLW
jgi:hypothetical protein